MSIENVFPSPDFSSTEEDIVIQCIQVPAFTKYLRRMAMEETKELLSLSAIHTDKDKLIQAHALVQGKLQVIATLLSIESTPTQEVQPE